jgi:hypothetical protein
MMGLLCWLAPNASGQTAAPPAAAPPNIADAWGGLVKNVLPQAAVDPVLKQQQTGAQKGAADDFAWKKSKEERKV